MGAAAGLWGKLVVAAAAAERERLAAVGSLAAGGEQLAVGAVAGLGGQLVVAAAVAAAAVAEGEQLLAAGR